MEGHEDEIGLAKASPFSFLPETSLHLKPLLINCCNSRAQRLLANYAEARKQSRRSRRKGGVGVDCRSSLRQRFVEADPSDEIGYCAGKPAP